MSQYAHHPQHYLSTQQSHRLLAYKPPPPQPPPAQAQSFIPTTSSTNLVMKRTRSPSSHIYASPSNKSSRPNPGAPMHNSTFVNVFLLFAPQHLFRLQDHLVLAWPIHHLHLRLNKCLAAVHPLFLHHRVSPLFLRTSTSWGRKQQLRTQPLHILVRCLVDVDQHRCPVCHFEFQRKTHVHPFDRS